MELIGYIAGAGAAGALVALVVMTMRWRSASLEAATLKLKIQELTSTLAEERSDYQALSDDHQRVSRELAAERTRGKLKADRCNKEIDKAISDAMAHGINPVRLAEMLSRTREELAR